jgi:hypothetical protein
MPEGESTKNCLRFSGLPRPNHAAGQEKQTRFLVDRRGEPQVVIMGIKDFINTIAPPPDVLKLIRAESKRKGTSKLTARQIDAEVRAARRQRRKQRA